MSRLVANGIDAIVIVVLISVAYLTVAGLTFFFDPQPFKFPKPHLLLTTGLSTGVTAAYLAIGWWISGRTPGKQVVGLRVVTAGGTNFGLGRSIARAAACVVFPFGFLWTAFSRRQASVQDLLLDTAVIYDWESHLAHRSRMAAPSVGGDPMAPRVSE
ncbi:MAG: RDD family protein [Actinomycetota bacterium]